MAGVVPGCPGEKGQDSVDVDQAGRGTGPQMLAGDHQIVRRGEGLNESVGLELRGSVLQRGQMADHHRRPRPAVLLLVDDDRGVGRRNLDDRRVAEDAVIGLERPHARPGRCGK